jgi:hypothetical protein
LNLRLSLLSFCSVLLFLASCREDTIISGSVTPSIDNIHTFGIGPAFGNDTISLETKTVYDDSIVTSASIAGLPIYHVLGYVNQDPYSGNTAGSVYLQVIPPVSSGFKLNDDPDSGFLVLPYANFTWGDTTVQSVQKYKVYAISEPFSKDSVYFTFSSKSVNTEVIGSGTFVIGQSTGHVADSVTVGNKRVSPHLRIELTKSFLHRLKTFLDGKQDSSYTAYLNAFPGFYIVPDSFGVSGRAMPYFRMDAASSDPYSVAGMILHKHADTTIYSFPFNANYTGHFNRVTRNYAQPEGRKLFNSTTANGMVMIQNQPGAAIDLVIPNISGLPKNVIINKCELVITKVFTDGDNLFIHPARIYPQGVDESGARYALLDRLPLSTGEGLNFIDGTPRTTIIGGNTVTRYSINFPRELQRAIVQGKSKLHLRIGGTQSFPGAYRLVAGGRSYSDPQYRMALNVVYSKQ